MKIDEKKIKVMKPAKSKKKINKNIFVLVALIICFFLIIVYIFNIKDNTKINTVKIKKTSKFNTQKRNEFNTQKINGYVSNKNKQAQGNKSPEQEEILKLKKQISSFKNSIKELEEKNKVLQQKSNKSINLTNKEETTNRDKMKDYLIGLKDNIKMEDNYFRLNGKNYYIGDEVNSYIVRDIRFNDIRFCGKKWCYTLRF